MVNRVKLALPQPEYSALLQDAMAALRTPEDQARYIIRQELARRNLLRLELAAEQPEEERREQLAAA